MSSDSPLSNYFCFYAWDIKARGSITNLAVKFLRLRALVETLIKSGKPRVLGVFSSILQ